jgi:hypothetical protein
MLPSRNFGAHSNIGTTGAIRSNPAIPAWCAYAGRPAAPIAALHVREGLVDTVALFRLAAQQRDALAVRAPVSV